MKRTFDLAFSIIGLLVLGPVIVVASVLARLDTGMSGFFRQERIGREGRSFDVLKLRTMRHVEEFDTVVTTERDPRITGLGRLLRKYKIDELPQLWNVLRGDMSLVGPRPDVPGFADTLAGNDRVILKVRPGITGPATVAFRDEESLLARQEDPERFNRDVLFPAKTRINRNYVENYRFRDDLRYILSTVGLASDDQASKRAKAAMWKRNP